jgi:hypothetical protein
MGWKTRHTGKVRLALNGRLMTLDTYFRVWFNFLKHQFLGSRSVSFASSISQAMDREISSGEKKIFIESLGLRPGIYLI